MKRARLRRSARTCKRHDERGSTIVMVLIVVMIVGILVSVALSAETSTYKTQTALVTKRQIDLAADGAIDTAIGAMRYDRSMGRYSSASPSSCSGQDTFTYDDPLLPSDIMIDCTPAVNSGNPAGTSGAMPDNTVLTMGGVGGWGYSGSNTNIPYCDDHHSRDARCEAGLFVGPGVNNPGLAGGLTVLDNGGAGDAVASNGAIIGKDESLDRTLNVTGSVWARRNCINVIQTGAQHCDQDAAGGTNTFQPDPLFRHEWTEPFTVACHPVTNQPAPGSVTSTQSLGLNKVTLPTYNDSVYGCTDGYMEFDPGWYSSLIGMNNLMENCPSALFYFKPGKYYFDFTDIGLANDPYWRAPRTSAKSSAVRRSVGIGAWARSRRARNRRRR